MMTNAERSALAIIRSGGSYADAMDAAKLSLDAVKNLYPIISAEQYRKDRERSGK